MKKILTTLAAVLCAAATCASQPVGDVIYRPQKLDGILALTYDTYSLLYGVEAIASCRNLVEEGKINEPAVGTVLDAVAAMAFQFGDSRCTVILPNGKDEYYNNRYRTYTLPCSAVADTLTVDLGEDEKMTFIAAADGTVQLEIGLFALKGFGLIDDTSIVTAPLQCDDLSIYVTMPHDGSQTIYRYIVTDPFAMRGLAATGVFAIIDEVNDSSITALFPTVELMQYILSQTEGVAVVVVGSSEGCPPCARFNATAFLPAVEQWLKMEAISSRAIIAYVDVGTDKQQVDMLKTVIGNDLSFPAVYFIRDGKQAAPAVAGCSDDAFARLVGSLQ